MKCVRDKHYSFFSYVISAMKYQLGDAADVSSYLSNIMKVKMLLILAGEENQEIRLICIPQFSTTHTAVMVDIENLDAEVVCFGTG